MQQPSLPVHADHGARMPMSGSGVGNVSVLNKGIQTVSPGAHGIASSSMLNSGSLLSSGMVAMPSPVNIQSGLQTGPENCMMRPPDPSHMMQPTQNLGDQRQKISQGSTEGASPIGALSSSPNQKTQTPGQLYPLHHPPYPMSTHQSLALGNSQIPHLQDLNQTSNTHHQVHMSRLAREKHIQQQRQYATSSALMPAVQGQSQLPLSSPQEISQFQPQTSSPPVSLPPVTPFLKHPQRHQIPPHGAGENPQVGGSGLSNQMEKQPRRQQQKQQFQQASRHHCQSGQQSRSQHQAMTLKGQGRGKIIMHNLPKKHALVNDLSTDSGSQFEAEGELDSPTMQGQGLYSGSGVNYVQSPKQLVTTAHYALPQHEMYSGQLYPHHNADNSNENNTLAATLQTVASRVVPSSRQQHSLLQPRAQSQLHAQPDSNIVDQTHMNLKKNLDRNCQVSANPPKKQQDVKAQSDLSPVINYSSQMGKSTLVSGSVEAATVNSVVSADVTQWKAPETLSDSHIFNQAEFGSIVSPSLTSSGCEPEPRPFLSQGLVERQSSVSLPPVQWLQKKSQLQPSILLPPIVQQKEKSEKQKSQKDPELVREEGISSLHINPTEL